LIHSLIDSYNTVEEFNVDLKAECAQLNLTHISNQKQNGTEKKLKQTPVPT